MSNRTKNKQTKTTEKKIVNCILGIILIHQKISLGLTEQPHFTTANTTHPAEDI